MFRTEVKVAPSPIKLELNQSVVCLGSCFAESIGNKLAENKISTLVNPGGIIYNPYSIGKLIKYSLNEIEPDDSTYLQNGEIYYNYDFHSRISDPSSNNLKERITHSLKELKLALSNCKWLIITFGTSIVYTRKENQEIVANCHKVPSENFTKGMLTQKQILSVFLDTYKSLMAVNPDITIILTVSPVRHLRDTLEINSVSKSILRIAADTISNEYPNIRYFPSYEIMMDDLRDYRFYANDMLHPTEQAFNYIWEKFCQAYASEEFLSFISRWEEIKKSMNHRPFHASTDAHRTFLKETLEKIKRLNSMTDLSKEIARIEKQLND